MRIKRSQVIEALRTEPLEAGSFFHEGMILPNGNFSTIKTCKVCAVGAVLRKTGLVYKLGKAAAVNLLMSYKYGNCICSPGDTGIKGGGTRKEVNFLIKSRQYFSALSVYFEGMAESGRIRRHRLVDFVKRTFPATITVK